MTIKYAYDANDILLRKFIYSPGIDEPICLIVAADGNAVYYYHFDGLGSVRVIWGYLGTAYSMQNRNE